MDNSLLAVRDINHKYIVVEWRLESFIPYCEFTRELEIYEPGSETLPAEVHVRNWRGKLNILHLNTALIADGTTKDNQLADTDAATSEKIWNNYFEASIPTLAIGHNSFFDLKEAQQTELEAVFNRKNVSAYLCGDQHRSEKNRNKQMIRLQSGHKKVPEIPNVVSMKGAADNSDLYSEFGFYWHDWNEETDEVKLYARIWKRDDEQSEFDPLGESGFYTMRRKDTDQKENVSQTAAKTILENDKCESRNRNYDRQIVQKAYFEYLAKELGIIQFDGIPTDKDSGSVKAELENIFVPLEFCRIDKEDTELLDDNVTIGAILTQNERAAILAKPGGGKSTLIRRIALAYAYNERKIKVDDDLPDYNWFPVYIRCRDLGENIQNSIMDNIFSIINRAELSQYRQAFMELIEEYVRQNQILLLIDGLDEISNEQYRVRFVEQLQTFAQRYPQMHLLITSRETGFRAVAAKLSDYCNQYVIVDLDEKRIRTLSQNWHEALLGKTSQAKADSDSVCKVILRDSRITALARNPLLLTTLLFVKRWIGYLPTKKCQLYQEMIKLLLVSWNAAAHLKMEMDETEPQLAFVAYEMTKKGKQTIQKSELMQCINEARNALPELLNYTTVSAAKFVSQVEERSSILIQQGLEEDEKGNLVPYYEFSHLSFQEYLAAKAISENWLPKEEQQGDSVYLSILKDHLEDTQWREVIPLVAALLNRKAVPVMKYLLEMCEGRPATELPEPEQHRKSVAAFHLANCIAAEVPLVPEMLENVLLTISIQSYGIWNISIQGAERNVDVFDTIYHSEKYGKFLKRVVEKELFENRELRVFSGLQRVWQKNYIEENGKQDLGEILKLLEGIDRKSRISGEILMIQWAFEQRKNRRRKREEKEQKKLHIIFSLILDLLYSSDEAECFFATWCIVWAGYNKANIIPDNYIPGIAKRLLHLWCNVSEFYEIRRQRSWAICTICWSGWKIERDDKVERAITVYQEQPETEFDKVASLYLSLLLGKTTVDNVKSEKISERYKTNRFMKMMEKMDED